MRECTVKRAFRVPSVVTYDISEDDGTQTVDVHVLQETIWVLNGRNVTGEILYGSLKQNNMYVSQHTSSQYSGLSLTHSH